jgi:hypothetical protein
MPGLVVGEGVKAVASCYEVLLFKPDLISCGQCVFVLFHLGFSGVVQAGILVKIHMLS